MKTLDPISKRTGVRKGDKIGIGRDSPGGRDRMRFSGLAAQASTGKPEMSPAASWPRANNTLRLSLLRPAYSPLLRSRRLTLLSGTANFFAADNLC